MAEYIYPTRANFGDEWVKNTVHSWKASHKRHLCFPWIKFDVFTITDVSFWLYMYYSLNRTDIPDLKGVIEYRFRLIDWSKSRFTGRDIYPAREDEPGTTWFLADQYQKIQKAEGGNLYLRDFRHTQGKRLGSAMRNSIPQVICKAKIVIVERYPPD